LLDPLGGALTDRFGRKGIIIFGLIASSFSAVAMGLVFPTSVLPAGDLRGRPVRCSRPGASGHGGGLVT